MVGVDKSSPYRAMLMRLISSIIEEVPLTEANQILLVYLLNTEEKIRLFARWILTKIGDHENDLRATEDEIVSAANHINREENARTR
jgi:hypothetical protein